jgi:hypothetical protein
MNGTTLIREKPVNPYSRSGNPQERSPAAGSPPTAGHIPEGVGFAAAAAGFPAPILTRAETAPCTCPEHCERDHEND